MLKKYRRIIIIINVILLPFNIAILNANKPSRTAGIAEALMETNVVLPENEGKLVMVSGTPTLENDGTIIDEEAGLQVTNAVMYTRQPYQLVYVLKKEEVVVDKGEDKLSDVDDKKELRIYVASDWIFADEKRKEIIRYGLKKYKNPPAIDMSHLYASNDMRIGEFLCSATDISYKKTKEAYFTKEELEKNCKEYIKNTGLNLKVIEDGDLKRGKLSSGNKIGDVKVLISYTTLESVEPVTIVGRQSGNTIVIDEAEGVNTQEHVLRGIVSKEEYVAFISREDAQSRKIAIVSIVVLLIALALTVVPMKPLKLKR